MTIIILDEREEDNIHTGDVWTSYLGAYPTPSGLGVAVMVDEIIGMVENHADFSEEGDIEIPPEIEGLWSKGIDGGDKIIGYEKIIDTNYQTLELAAVVKPELEKIQNWLQSLPFDNDNAIQIVELWHKLFTNEDAFQHPKDRTPHLPSFQSEHRGLTTLAEQMPDDKMDDFASAMLSLAETKWQTRKTEIENEVLACLKGTNWIWQKNNIPAERTIVNNVELEADLLLRNNEKEVHCIVRPCLLRQEGISQISDYHNKIKSIDNRSEILLVFFENYSDATLNKLKELGMGIAIGQFDIPRQANEYKLRLLVGHEYLVDLFPIN